MTVRLENAGAYLVVHNQTEKKGAITSELYATILRALDIARARPVRCIILTGGAFFCAGGDLNVLKTRATLPARERRARIEVLHDLIRAMNNTNVPLIAAIEGGAAGAGLSLVLACDLIVAADDASFTAAYVKAGLTPDGGLTQALGRLVPRQLSMEMCLLGRSIPATRFAELGVVSQICPKGQALGVAKVIADHLAQGPGQAQSRIRQLVSQATQTDLSTQLDQEAAFMVEAQASPDAAEGIAAFLEKRPAVFKS